MAAQWTHSRARNNLAADGQTTVSTSDRRKRHADFQPGSMNGENGVGLVSHRIVGVGQADRRSSMVTQNRSHWSVVPPV